MASHTSRILALLLAAAGSSLATGYTSSSLTPRGPVSFPLSLESVQRHSGSLEKRNADIFLYNISAAAYLVTLSIGTPGQRVRVTVDTGSDELWVNPVCNFTSYYVDDADVKQCQSSGRYDPTLSNTSIDLHRTDKIRYGKGSVHFQYYNDTVTQPDSDISVKNFHFGVATRSTDLYEGILGLGFAQNKGYPTFASAIAEQGAAGGTTNVFSVALASSNEANAGVLVLGGVDTERFAGRMMPVPILPPPEADTLVRYWVKLDSIGLSDSGSTSSLQSNDSSKVYPGSGGPVVLDTGTTLSILPSSVIAALANDLGGGVLTPLDTRSSTSTPTAHFYKVPCAAIGRDSDVHSKDNQAGLKRTVDFSFNNGSAFIRVPLYEFSSEVTSSQGGPKTCVLGALAVDTDSSSSSGPSVDGLNPDLGLTMLLGASFLRGAYVAFDQSANSVYMAPYARCLGNNSNLQPLASEAPGMAGTIDGSCEVKDTLYAGGAGGYAAVASSNGTGTGSGSGNKKNAGSPVNSSSTASVMLAVLSVALALLLA
ncbi:hypothetical protein SBRCBS47491_003622 [Sporothrix bragantina]|uniref:Peptidase A1 domain-containing protein n=1 Tax=Sporothrix bragantina TaxID=671064 RepID=A0ABP0BGU6_9PEZI